MSDFHNRLQKELFGRLDEYRAIASRRYPHQFVGPIQECCWPEGWQHLVLEACALLHQMRPDFRWITIKEKFGGLRLYYEGGPFRADIHTDKGLISLPIWPDGIKPEAVFEKLIAIEIESRRTCGCCGAGGDLAKLGGYYITLCTDCAGRHGADFVRPQEA